MKKQLPFMWIFVLLLIILSSCSYLPETELEGWDVAMEENRDYIEILPEQSSGISPTGIVFYPGGLVDPHAYVDLCIRLALSGRGHRVRIVKMPANLAVLAPSSARKAIRDRRDEPWVISGHSLGGAMACSMVEKEDDLFRGLVLMAAYPGASTDLSGWDSPVLSLSASEDRVVDAANFESGKERLPAGTVYFDIAGGNHSGFGSYGPQDDDGEATISRTIQHNIIVQQFQQFLNRNGLN